MTLHHIAELRPVLTGFATMLTEGGHLCIVDLEAEDGSFHEDSAAGHEGHFHVHDGFDPDELSDRLADAGFSITVERSVAQVMKGDRPYPLFLATCTADQLRA